MTTLSRVTFTGADDSVDPIALRDLSDEFPYVEWGILFSQSSQGQPRFPSEAWIRSLPEHMASSADCHLSAHLCGGWVRDLLLRREFSWFHHYHDVAGWFERVQVNTHSSKMDVNAIEAVARTTPDFKFILQVDGANDDQIRTICAGTPARFHALFDISGGAGVVPESWPAAWDGVYCGYAGGLGPDTIARQMSLIGEAAGSARFWIDMERRVRSDDDRMFDLDKVRTVLEFCDEHFF